MIRRIILSLFMSLFMTLFDPFDLETSINSNVNDFFQFVFQEPSLGANANTAIILIDENFLHQTGSSWPLQYSQYAGLIHSISRYEPEAIVLDFALIDVRQDETLDYFLNTVRSVSQRAPIIFVAPHREDKSEMLERLKQLKADGADIYFAAPYSASGYLHSSQYDLVSDDGNMRSVALTVTCLSSHTVCDDKTLSSMEILWSGPFLGIEQLGQTPDWREQIAGASYRLVGKLAAAILGDFSPEALAVFTGKKPLGVPVLNGNSLFDSASISILEATLSDRLVELDPIPGPSDPRKSRLICSRWAAWS